MKHQKLINCCAVSIALTFATSSLATLNSGQDKKIAWNTVKSWSIPEKSKDMVHSLDGKYVYILNDKQQVQIFDNQGQLQGSIPVAKDVDAIDISPKGDFLYVTNNKTKSFSAIGISFIVDIDIAGSPSKGPVDAPVTIALFTDFECPYCSKLGPLLDQVIEKNSKNVKLVFKNMPLQFHKMAQPSARAALAAHEQGKFWEFHDRLFAEKKLSNEAIKTIAQDLELDIPRFEKDMASPKVQAQINKDLQDAREAGVTGTPTAFINGVKLQQRSLEGFQTLIDAELKKRGKK